MDLVLASLESVKICAGDRQIQNRHKGMLEGAFPGNIESRPVQRLSLVTVLGVGRPELLTSPGAGSVRT